jgi:DNA invertase Pin-like site-specific DNA recombinase
MSVVATCGARLRKGAVAERPAPTARPRLGHLPRVCDGVGAITDAGHSARSLDRPGLAYALSRLRAGRASVLVVSRLDRLSRSMIDFAGLMADAQREGWAIVALDLGVDTTTPEGEKEQGGGPA